MIINCYHASCQSGFRPFYSTLTAFLVAKNSWSVNIGNVILNGVVFIALKKAFHTIDHEIILRKMPHFRADQATVTWFQSYQSNRTLRCIVNGRLSTPRTVTCALFFFFFSCILTISQTASGRPPRECLLTIPT